MAFNDEVVKDGRGVVYKIDVSLDSFASIVYRWSTSAGIDATNEYDPRIKAIGRLTRGLGADHVMQAGTAELVLGNDDEGVDWLVDQATAINTLKARLRLYIGIYDPAAPTSIEWKQLGEFVFSEFPSRDVGMVRASIADDSFGRFGAAVQSPTIGDWYDQDTSSTTNPLRSGTSFAFGPGARSMAIPIVLGEGVAEAFSCGVPLNVPSSATFGVARAFVVCSTTSSAAAADTDIEIVTIRLRDGLIHKPPKTHYPTAGTATSVWSVVKSATITKNSKTFKVLALLLLEGFATWFEDAVLGGASSSSSPARRLSAAVSQIDRVFVNGSPFSSITTPTPATGPRRASDNIKDIVAYYSGGSISDVNTASFDRVMLTVGGGGYSGGVVSGGADDASLRDHLGDIASSGDLDVFVRFDGTVALSARNLDYTSQTATLLEIDETRTSDLRDFIPSREQRGAPYNRVALSGDKSRELEISNLLSTRPWVEFAGPYDDPGGSIAAWGRVFQRTISKKWQSLIYLGRDPWTFRNLDATIRTMVEFTTDLEALQLELGDYFKLNWTRNLGTDDPYTSTIFQVEELALDPATGTVSVTALWADDLLSDKPYLLDDETMMTRVSSGGGRTVTVTDGSDALTFSSGDLAAEGVAQGDHLILKDATEAATLFTRNRALRIKTIVSTVAITIEEVDLDFDAPAGAAVSTWEIRRSRVTGPAVGATNYAEGSAMYGGISNLADSGTYTDAVTAHKLVD